MVFETDKGAVSPEERCRHCGEKDCDALDEWGEPVHARCEAEIQEGRKIVGL